MNDWGPRGRCPACQSDKVTHVVFGIPADMDEAPPWVRFAGCVFEPGAGDRHCDSCGHAWRSTDQGPSTAPGPPTEALDSTSTESDDGDAVRLGRLAEQALISIRHGDAEEPFAFVVDGCSVESRLACFTFTTAFLEADVPSGALVIVVHDARAWGALRDALTGMRRVSVRPGAESIGPVLLAGMPPVHDFGYLTAWRRLIQDAGIDAQVEPIDDDALNNEEEPATGEKTLVQVLGWDDIYDESEWMSIASEGSFELVIPRHGLSASTARDLVRVISSTRVSDFTPSLIDASATEFS